jgi:hypothetical protein
VGAHFGTETRLQGPSQLTSNSLPTYDKRLTKLSFMAGFVRNQVVCPATAISIRLLQFIRDYLTYKTAYRGCRAGERLRHRSDGQERKCKHNRQANISPTFHAFLKGFRNEPSMLGSPTLMTCVGDADGDCAIVNMGSTDTAISATTAL